jgi:Zn-dependent protease
MKIKIHPSVYVGILLFSILFSMYGLYYHLAGVIKNPFTILPFSVLLSVGMYASIFLHETGHYFIAEYYGIKVEEISMSALSAFTRVAKTECDPNTWVLRAASGIYLNLLLGFTLLIVSYFTSGIYSRFLDLLGLLNIGLGLTNLIPFKTKLGGTDGYNLILNLWKITKGISK